MPSNLESFIDTEELSDDAITAAKIAASAVQSEQVDADAITAAKIAADAVDSEHIATDAVTQTELSFDTATQSELDTHEGDSDAHHSRYSDSEARTAVDGSNVSITGDADSVDGQDYSDIQSWVNNNADVPNADYADNAGDADTVDGKDANEINGAQMRYKVGTVTGDQSGSETRHIETAGPKWLGMDIDNKQSEGSYRIEVNGNTVASFNGSGSKFIQTIEELSSGDSVTWVVENVGSGLIHDGVRFDIGI